MRTTRALAAVLLITACAARAGDLIPPLSKIKPDRPRLLLRPHPTPYAISLEQLRAPGGGADYAAMLGQLRKQDDAASQAMVWLLTGDKGAAEKAVARLRAYRFPGKVDTFHIQARLTEFALAYDWLHGCPQFTDAIKAEVRGNIAPLAREGLRVTNDHVFHNYIWMSAGGVAMWALATAGEDDACSALFERIRARYNDGLYPAWRYLDGLPSEPMGYWALYVFTPGLYTLLAAQSASETDLVAATRTTDQGAWLDRNFENLVHGTLPDMRYIPWGDLQGGPNGGVTMEMAGAIDAATWALNSPAGRQFGSWLAGKRGLSRFYGDTAIFYMLYTRALAAKTDLEPTWPGLSFLAGNRQGGHFIARSAWADEATVVAFTCTDHYGDHHHYDQGSFTIYRRGLLAVDPPVYRQTRGPQQKTEYHNTLLIGGRAQRPARGQWFVTVEDFKKNLAAGRRLETGDITWWRDSGAWAAVSGQFAQAYDCPELKSCLRQVAFVRPGTVVVVDRLEAAPGKQVPEVRWLLQLPGTPRADAGTVTASNGRAWIRCRAVHPGAGGPGLEPTPMKTQCASFAYAPGANLTLVHVLDVGDGAEPAPAAPVKVIENDQVLQVTIGDQALTFAPGPEGAVSSAPASK